MTLKGGTAYPLGAVPGRITATGVWRLSPAAVAAGDEGAETASAVLIAPVDATAGDATGLVLARGPVILSRAALVLDPSVDQPAELAAAGLVIRDTA